VLQFDLEAAYKSGHRIVYTGTHDNDTVVGWFDSISAAEQKRVLKMIRSDGKRIHWDLIRYALRSPAPLVIIPVQDILGLGSQARMNRPGVARGNWDWRLRPGEIPDDAQQELRRLVEESERL